MKLDTANILTTKELQTTFLWEVILPQLSSGIDSVDANTVSALVQEVSFGGYNMEEIFSQRVGSAEMFSAGHPTISTVTLSILSSTDGDVVNYFDEWRRRIFDTSQGHYFTKDYYVFPVTCILYDKLTNDKVTFLLKNAFPKTFPRHDLSYKTDSFVEFKIELVVDDIQVIVT
jgi:hypothetical protein